MGDHAGQPYAPDLISNAHASQPRDSLCGVDQRGHAICFRTVVRAQCPTSARPGDSAIVFADGSIEGFVGGQCAEGSVRLAAVPLLESGASLLLRILPEGADDFPESDGSLTVVNPCLSGGALEIFLEPRLPAPGLAIVGNSPIAHALELFAESLGFGVQRSAEVPNAGGHIAVLISSHGRNEVEAIQAALEAKVGFIGLVASSTRGKAVLSELDLSKEDQAADQNSGRVGHRGEDRRRDRPVGPS